MTVSLADFSPDAIALTAITSSSLERWCESCSPTERRWIQSSGFEAKAGSWCLLPGADGALNRVLVGTEDRPDLWSCAGLPLALPEGDYALDDSWPAEQISALSLGWLLGSYRYDRYRAAERLPARLCRHPDCDEDWVEALADGIFRTRDLVNTPAQDMMPQHLSAALAALAEEHGAEFEETAGAELLARNYPVIHAVGRASVHAPRLADLRWGDPAHPKLTLVGKGVCFDSGGLDLKPASAMRLMKKDMGGAAHVIGLAATIMRRQLPVRLRVLVPAVENAVSGDAFRPGDVLTSRSGKTVEIDNTDAEGRLVLCDALSAAIDEEPDLLIDMATLTGAARVALGPDLPAIFANRPETANALCTSAEAMDDPVWQLPLHAPYKRWLKSDIADLQNSAATPYAGAITAALFLQEFVGKERDWLHMDVMAWNTESLPGRPRGGEAMALRAFAEMLARRYPR